jgi:hypothetical protein
MDDNNLDKQNQPEQPEQNDISMLDKVMQNNPFLKLGEAKYENVQTQSVVQSAREEANAQLAAINARNEAILREQKRAEDAAKAKKTGVYVIVAIIFMAILGVGAWLIINAVMAGQGTVKPEEITNNGGGTKYGNIEGFKCTSEQCEKIADVDENTIIVNDSSKYYLFNKTDSKKNLTSIASKVYHAITSFKWGDKTLAILDPESGQSALYDITANHQITDFSYDEFYTDTSADTYKDMAGLTKNYIVARNGSSQRLIDLADGTEKIRANKKVFVHDKFFFAYETDGTIHIYNDAATQFVVAKADDTVFTKNGYVVIIGAKGGTTVYNTSGTKASDDFSKAVNAIPSKNRLNALLNDTSYYHVPANN